MPIVHEDEEWLTLEEAASYLGISTAELMSEIREENILAERINGRWYVSSKGAERYRRLAGVFGFAESGWNLLQKLGSALGRWGR